MSSPKNVLPSERANGFHEIKLVKDLQTWKNSYKEKKPWINLKFLQFSQLNNEWNKWTTLAAFFPCSS